MSNLLNTHYYDYDEKFVKSVELYRDSSGQIYPNKNLTITLKDMVSMINDMINDGMPDNHPVSKAYNYLIDAFLAGKLVIRSLNGSRVAKVIEMNPTPLNINITYMWDGDIKHYPDLT